MMKTLAVNPVTTPTLELLKITDLSSKEFIEIDRIPFENLTAERNHGNVAFNYHEVLLESNHDHSTLLDGPNVLSEFDNEFDSNAPQQVAAASPFRLMMRTQANWDMTPANAGIGKTCNRGSIQFCQFQL